MPPLGIRDKTTRSNYERSLTQLSHNIQKYISLTITRTLEKNFKKRDHGMIDLQPILTETLRIYLRFTYFAETENFLLKVL